ncbi:unnamed protein product [Umbelopsis ramanniana]
MLAARNRLLASKSRSFKEEEEDDMIFEHAPSGKFPTITTNHYNPYRDSNRVEHTEVDRESAWLMDRTNKKGKSNYSSSQDRTDYVVSEQARALSAKRARLASDLSDEERPSYSHRGASQSQRSKPPPASLNIDAFTLSSNTFDNRKLRADLERAKRWIKQAEESYEELANIRYTEAEKNLETLREKYEDRFESSEKLIKSLQLTQHQLEVNLDSTREELKARREQVETLRKENAALQAQCKEQGTTTLDRDELQQFNRWKKSKSYMDSDANHDIMAERDRLKAQVTQLTATVRLREQERDTQIEKAKSTESKKSLLANGIYSTSDGSKNDKTEMYEDLTGLLLTDVKKSNESIVYNCLQTGRNGTLHFKLTQNNSQPNELHYQPMLDERRDADLIMRLPDYLTTEIEFTRDKANLFFWRLLTFLQSSDKKDHASKH